MINKHQYWKNFVLSENELVETYFVCFKLQVSLVEKNKKTLTLIIDYIKRFIPNTSKYLEFQLSFNKEIDEMEILNIKDKIKIPIIIKEKYTERSKNLNSLKIMTERSKTILLQCYKYNGWWFLFETCYVCLSNTHPMIYQKKNGYYRCCVFEHPRMIINYHYNDFIRFELLDLLYYIMIEMIKDFFPTNFNYDDYSTDNQLYNRWFSEKNPTKKIEIEKLIKNIEKIKPDKLELFILIKSMINSLKHFYYNAVPLYCLNYILFIGHFEEILINDTLIKGKRNYHQSIIIIDFLKYGGHKNIIYKNEDERLKTICCSTQDFYNYTKDNKDYFLNKLGKWNTHKNKTNCYVPPSKRKILCMKNNNNTIK